jgi:hypothetical protein
MIQLVRHGTSSETYLEAFIPSCFNTSGYFKFSGSNLADEKQQNCYNSIDNLHRYQSANLITALYLSKWGGCCELVVVAPSIAEVQLERRVKYVTTVLHSCLLLLDTWYMQQTWNECQRSVNIGRSPKKLIMCSAINTVCTSYNIPASTTLHVPCRTKIGSGDEPSALQRQ